MINIMLGVLGLLCIIAGIGLAIFNEKKIYGLFAIVGIFIVIVSSSFAFVPSGYVGVRTAYGQISDKPTKNGLNWKTPFIEQIHMVNCKQQEKDFESLQIWSETSERTEVYCESVVVDYQINSEYAAWIWTNVEEWDTNLVKQTSIESGIKSATKQYNDTDVTDRSKIELTAKECIQNSLNEKYGQQIVNVVFVTIGNINFSDAYNEAIEKKAQAKLAAEAAEYANKQQTQAVQAQAEQTKIQAEAQAEQARIKAQGDADAIQIKAEAEAAANKLIAESLTDELIENNKISRWDGTLPYVSGSGATIIDLGSQTVENQGVEKE